MEQTIKGSTLKSFFKAYTLPFLMLLLGIGIYYVVFEQSVKRHPQKQDSTNLAQKELPSAQTPQHKTAKIDTQELDSTPKVATNDKNLKDTKEASKADKIDTPKAQEAESKQPQIAQESATKPTQAEANFSKDTPYYSIATDINLRALPDKNAQILGKIGFGERVIVTDIDGQWVQLHTTKSSQNLDSALDSSLQERLSSTSPSDKPLLKGWAHAQFFSITPPPSRPYFVSAEIINIREKPDVKSRSIGVLRKGAQINITRIYNDWAQLDSLGWVNAPLIKDTKQWQNMQKASKQENTKEPLESKEQSAQEQNNKEPKEDESTPKDSTNPKDSDSPAPSQERANDKTQDKTNLDSTNPPST